MSGNVKSNWCVFYVRAGVGINPVRFRTRDDEGKLNPSDRKDFNEFIVARRIGEMGLEAWCGRRLDFIRSGKKRRAEAKEAPCLRNYVFVRSPGMKVLDIAAIPEVAPIYAYLNRNADLRSFERFREAVNSEYDERQRILANREAVVESGYAPGQAIYSDSFGDTILRFRRLVERSFDLFPHVEADIYAMGQTVRVLLDPLDVRPAKSVA